MSHLTLTMVRVGQKSIFMFSKDICIINNNNNITKLIKNLGTTYNFI